MVYCLNFHCDKKELCERAKLMDKKWFFENVSKLEPNQVYYFNRNNYKECKDKVDRSH